MGSCEVRRQQKFTHLVRGLLPERMCGGCAHPSDVGRMDAGWLPPHHHHGDCPHRRHRNRLHGASSLEASLWAWPTHWHLSPGQLKELEEDPASRRVLHSVEEIVEALTARNGGGFAKGCLRHQGHRAAVQQTRLNLQIEHKHTTNTSDDNGITGSGIRTSS